MTEHQQILIACHNQISIAAHCCGKDLIVVRISTDGNL